MVAPPPLSELSQFKDEFAGGKEKSKHFGDLYRKQAEEFGCLFMDAGEFVISSNLDGIHWDKSGHLKFAEAVAKYLSEQNF